MKDYLSVKNKLVLIKLIVAELNQNGYYLTLEEANNFLDIKNAMLQKGTIIFPVYKKGFKTAIARISFKNSFYNFDFPQKIVWDIMLYKYRNEDEMKTIILTIQKKIKEVKFRLLISGNQ